MECCSASVAVVVAAAVVVVCMVGTSRVVLEVQVDYPGSIDLESFDPGPIGSELAEMPAPAEMEQSAQ